MRPPLQAVRGLSLNMQASAQTPFLRGIGTNAGAVGNESAVALYFDNICISSAQATWFKANASLQWTEPGERYYGRVWARNIFNVYHSNYSTIGTVGHFDTPAEPRVYGLTLGYNWGG